MPNNGWDSRRGQNCVLMGVLLLAACAGSPVGAPRQIFGTTAAPVALQQQIIRLIGRFERRLGQPGREPWIVDTRFIDLTGSVLREEWTVRRQDRLVVYAVEISSSQENGTGIKIRLPRSGAPVSEPGRKNERWRRPE